MPLIHNSKNPLNLIVQMFMLDTTKFHLAFFWKEAFYVCFLTNVEMDGGMHNATVCSLPMG